MALRSDRLDAIVSLSKRRGFVYPSSEIYGGLRAAWDYGPLGVELKNNIKRQWWRAMVTERDDIVGLDSSVILAREVWEASGHVTEFTDPLTECTSCHKRYRADHLIEAYEEKHGHAPAERSRRHHLPELRQPGHLHRAAHVQRHAPHPPGPGGGRLRPGLPAPGDRAGHLHQLQERAADLAEEDPVRHRPDRQVVPQRDHPGQLHLPDPGVRADGDGVLRQAGTDEEWHQRWIDTRLAWYTDLGIRPENLRLYEHPREKLSHYSKRTVDIEYRFDFAGSEWGELEGIANRTDFDLKTHQQASKQDLSYLDQESGERFIPYVIEPAAGVDRGALVFLLDAYAEDEAPDAKGKLEKRTVLRLDPQARAGEGGGAAAVAQRRPVAEGPRPGRGTAQAVEHRLRRRQRDRPPVPAAGRDRHAVLRHRRLRHPGRPGRHGPGAGHACARNGSASTASRPIYPSASAPVSGGCQGGRPPWLT